jgi:hypothetical protein
LRGILLQAGDDPIDVGNLCTAEPENVRRAGHLLLHGSPVLLRKSRRLTEHATRGGYRKTQENPVRSHIRSFFRIQGACMFDEANQSTKSFKMNAAGESSCRTIKSESAALRAYSREMETTAQKHVKDPAFGSDLTGTEVPGPA